MMVLTLSIFVSVIAVVSCGGFTPPTTTAWPTLPPVTFSPRQIELQGYCNKFCKLDECYFPVPTDCRRFIRCTSVPNGYIGYDYACPMGTKYDKDGHCIHAPDDKCLYKPCLRGETKYPDERCNTYIECNPETETATPKCCPPHHRYNEVDGTCNMDYSCADDCPLQPSGVCDDPTVVTEASDHGPCNAYIECVLGVPEKRCCDIGQSYSRTYQRCVTDPKCRDTCVAPPKKECIPGSSGYSTTESCSSYITCVSNKPFERRCCDYGFGFNDQSQRCEPLTEPIECILGCPRKHISRCNLEPGPTANTFYAQDSTVLKICANGTMFSKDVCVCIDIPNLEDNSCNLELGLYFENLNMRKEGSDKQAYIWENGNATNGKVYDGLYSYKFDPYYLNIPFYQTEFQQFTFKVVFYPENINVNTKSILLSNCQQYPYPSQPSLEIILDRNFAVLKFKTVAGNEFNQVAVQYGLNTWNTLTASYNGIQGVVTNVFNNQQDSNYVDATGAIPQGVGPLYCGSCGDPSSAFKGSIAQYEFKKCVDPE